MAAIRVANIYCSQPGFFISNFGQFRTFHRTFHGWYNQRAPYTRISEFYEFIPAKQTDFNSIVDLCVKEFLKVEPQSRALGLKPSEATVVFEWYTQKALHYPFSLMIVHKKTKEFIGFRLMSISHRDRKLDWEPFDLQRVPLDENVTKIKELFERSQTNFWKIVPEDVQKVLHRDLAFVMPQYQGKGIARHLQHLGLDFSHLKYKGIHGIVSESTSAADQRILETSGYQCLYEIPKDVEKGRGTDGIKVMFKDLRV